MNNYDDKQSDNQFTITTLWAIATLSNMLAKMLNGTPRSLAYRIKARACTALIIAGVAKVTGTWANGIVSLSFGRDRTDRIHIPRSHLTKEAKAIVDREAASAPTLYRLTTVLLPGGDEK